MDTVTGQCPQTTTFLKRKERRSGIEPRSFRLPAYRLTARPNRLSRGRRWSCTLIAGWTVLLLSCSSTVISRTLSLSLTLFRTAVETAVCGVNKLLLAQWRGPHLLNVVLALADGLFGLGGLNTIQYNTTLMSLCREICFLARHLFENIQYN